MRYRIWKYAVPVTDSVSLDLPSGAELLTVQVQHGLPHVWAKVDPEAPKTSRTFHWFGTGHPIPDRPLAYVGTVQSPRGDLVFHLFVDIPD